MLLSRAAAQPEPLAKGKRPLYKNLPENPAQGNRFLAEEDAAQLTSRCQLVRCAQNRIGVRPLTIEDQVLIRLGATIYPLLAARYMIIVVQLMHDGNERR